MSRYRVFEYSYDDNVELVASVALDAEGAVDWEWFTVFIFIRGFEKDITKAFSDAEIEDFKEAFKLGCLDKHYEALRAGLREYDNDDYPSGAA